MGLRSSGLSELISVARTITRRRSVIILPALVVLVALVIVGSSVLPGAAADNNVRDLGAGLAGMGTNVNQDFDVAVGVRNDGSAPVIFRGATLIDLPSYRNLTLDAPRRVRDARRHHGDHRWPPRKNGEGEKGSFVIHPFNGLDLEAHQLVYIVYA